MLAEVRNPRFYALSYSYLLRSMYLPSAVSPTTELEIALLIVKRKPCNVYLAGALKDAWRDIEAAALAVDHHVGLERAVKLLVRAVGGGGGGGKGKRRERRLEKRALRFESLGGDE